MTKRDRDKQKEVKRIESRIFLDISATISIKLSIYVSNILFDVDCVKKEKERWIKRERERKRERV